MSRVAPAVRRLRAAVALAREAEVTFLAAAIAYYAFVSLLPALLLALALASAFGGDALVARVEAATGAFLTPVGQEALADALGNARGRTGATLVGLAVLAWSTLRVFRGLDIAFSRVYGTSDRVTFLGSVRDAAVVAATIGAGMAGMVVVGAVLAAATSAGGAVLGLLLLFGGLVAAFLPLYYVFPDADLPVRQVLPGTAVAAVGWVALQALFQAYAAVAPRFELYGVVGGILLLVTWFYAAAVVVLFGAAVNAVSADRQGQEPPRPD